MTREEFLEGFRGGKRVICDTVAQRYALLTWLRDNGFRLGSCTSEYLTYRYEDDEYMCPGYESGEIHSWTRFVTKNNYHFCDIEHVIYGTDVEEIELPSIDELLI